LFRSVRAACYSSIRMKGATADRTEIERSKKKERIGLGFYFQTVLVGSAAVVAEPVVAYLLHLQ